MAIRNNKLGGTDFADGEILYDYDLDDTFNATINSGASGQAQVPYTTLKSTGTWVNEGYLASDRFTTASGVNSTVNTGGSTALFDTDKYINNIFFNIEANQNIIGTNTSSGDEGSIINNPNNFFDGNISTFSEFQHTSGTGNNRQYMLGRTFSERFVTKVRCICSFTGSTTTAVGTFSRAIIIQTYDGSSWTSRGSTNFNGPAYPSNHEDTKTTLEVDVGENIQGIRVIQSYTRQYNYSTTIEGRFYVVFETDNTNLESSLVCDQNILRTSNNVNVSIYNDSVIPANTSIKAKINDGVQDVSSNVLLSENKTTIIPLTATPTAGNQLRVIYTLGTTDTAVTPELYGYGVYKQ